MPTILKESKPTARKEHRCDYCNGIIKIGTRYHRDTLIYDDKPYDWCCHSECSEITHDLKMWDWVRYEGLSQQEFIDCVNEYIYDTHYDKEIDDIAEDWQDLTTHEAVLKILKEDFKREV